MNYTYRFRLYPNKEQIVRLNQHFGHCRFVYNHFLNQSINKYHEEKKTQTFNQNSADLTILKKELTWLNEANAQSLQQSLKDLEKAFKNFFTGKAKFPKFHKKNDEQSFRIPQSINLSKNKLKFPKFSEGIKIKVHRTVIGKIKFVTIKRNHANQYFATICVETSLTNLPKLNTEVGLDLGITALVTCSDGTKFPNIRPFKNLEGKIKRLQRKLSRAKLGSKGRERVKRKLAKLHQKVASIRMNHLHQISHKIISENQAIFMENLNVSGMLKNRCLSKALGDASFSEFSRQLEYKSEWFGRIFGKIGRFFPSSKTCSSCGFIKKDLGLKDRSWVCPECQVHHDRDINAAVNILTEGRRTVGTTGIAG
jgi:putative transposase